MISKKTLLGFIIAPIASSILFSITINVIVFLSIDGSWDLPLSVYLIALRFWFFYGITAAYPVILAIGIPGYLMYKKNGLTSFKSYLIGGLILGILAPFLLISIFGVSETLNFNIWVFLIGGIFGGVTCATFWLISIKNSKNV